MDTIRGYKAFNKDMTNRYGASFEEGRIYCVKGPISFGVRGNGYHFCARLEDTLRYVPAMEEEIKIAKVIGLEEIVTSNDEYYGYYDMYVARSLYIDKILTREEIITQMSKANPIYVKRFVSSFALTEEEIQLFRINYVDDLEVQRAIAYFQEHDENAYARNRSLDYYKVKVKNISNKNNN